MKRRLLALFPLVLAGCGYHLRGDLHPPGGVHSVLVPTFVNRTYEPGLELPFTEKIRDELLKGRAVRLVTEKRDADAVITGEVLTFRAVPTVLVRPPDFPVDKSRLLPIRYRAVIEVKISLISVSTGEVLWEDKLEGTEEYDAGQAPEGFEPLARESQQQAAVTSLAEDLMREAYDRMMTDF